MHEGQGVVVVSNRLPVIVRTSDDGSVEVEPGNGGLVTALTPVLRQRRGTWIGWTGSTDPLTPEIEAALDATARSRGLKLCALSLTPEEVQGYYRGFSSEILWPLFHDLANNCRFEASYWDSYSRVNRKVARLVADSARPRDFVWIQDYHFLTSATELRRLGADNLVGFFLHVPFPPPEIFARLPWRRQILEGLLDFDVVGFQSENDTENFLRCAHAFVLGRDIGGSRLPRLGSPHQTWTRPRSSRGREVTVGSFPISIDYHEFRGLAESARVRDIAESLRAHFDGQKILLGVDRLDYTKGLPHKLRGYRLALERHPELRRRITLVQYVVPSRESVPEYRELRPEIERLVGEINGEFGTPGWVPVRYFYQSLPREELCAYYRLADALVVTSLKDGMNLVAKEYCASNVGETGVLVLSEFAGASSQLGRDALLVNPHDVEAVERAVQTAVIMPFEERRKRMASLRRIVERNDVYRWVSQFLETAMGHSELNDSGMRPRSAAVSLAAR